jgi:hypothetical protein
MSNYPIHFEINQYHSCCGIQVVHNFRQPEYSGYREKVKQLKSFNAVFDKFYSEMLAGLKENFEYANEEYEEGQVYIVQIVLTPELLPKMPPLLLAKGWTELFNFKNANSGNKVTMYQIGLTPIDIGLPTYNEYSNDKDSGDW